MRGGAVCGSGSAVVEKETAREHAFKAVGGGTRRQPLAL